MSENTQNAIIKTWDGTIGTAQTPDGGIYEITQETMTHANVTIGEHIKITWRNGKLAKWQIAPNEEPNPTHDELFTMSGRKFFACRSKIALLEIGGILACLIGILLMELLLMNPPIENSYWMFRHIINLTLGIVAVRFWFWLPFHANPWMWTDNEKGIIVSRRAQKDGYLPSRYLAWHNIASVEIHKSQLLRRNYLYITPKITQPKIKLALFLLSPDDQKSSLNIIHNRIQAANPLSE